MVDDIKEEILEKEDLEEDNFISSNNLKYIPKTDEDRKKIMMALRKDNQELYMKYNELGYFSSPLKPDNKSLSLKIMELATRSLGMYGSERLNVNLYYLFQACDLLIPIVGESWLEEQYNRRGKSWVATKNSFEILRKKITRMKIFYDHIENQRFDAKKNISKTQQEILICFRKYARRISAMQPELYFLFVILCENTSLKARKIPSSDFKIIEQGDMKKMLMSKKPYIESASQGISEIKRDDG